jgi:hypothetical protein
MAVTNQPYSVVRGKIARFTKLSECGAPLFGQLGQGITKGFVKIEYKPEIDEGEDITLVNADGEFLVNEPACPTLRYYAVQVTFGRVDPELYSLATGQQLVVDYAGNPVGMRVGEKVACDGGFALETWSGTGGGGCASATASRRYGYFLLPWVRQGVLQDFTLENDAASFVIEGKTAIGGQWGTGPYPVVAADAAGTPGKLLTPIAADQHLHFELTPIAPPAPVNGLSLIPAAT